jgi:hypothetical protein
MNSTLNKMKNIFETCNVPSDGHELERAFPKMLKVNYTETEEAWSQFDKTIHRCNLLMFVIS